MSLAHWKLAKHGSIIGKWEEWRGVGRAHLPASGGPPRCTMMVLSRIQDSSQHLASLCSPRCTLLLQDVGLLVSSMARHHTLSIMRWAKIWQDSTATCGWRCPWLCHEVPQSSRPHPSVAHVFILIDAADCRKSPLWGFWPAIWPHTSA